jgi:lipopolysaccharide export system permease protein
MYSLGVSKKDLIRPIMFIASIITFGFIVLNTIPAFVDANQKAKNIKRYNNPDKTTSSIFLKSDNNYVYIEKLLPAKKEGTNLKVFITKDNKLIEILHAKNAKFENNYWNLLDVTSIKVPMVIPQTKEANLEFSIHKSKQTLHGFKPKIIDTLFQNNSKLTIPNAIDALTLLEEQNLNKNRIKSDLYTMAIFPLFAPIVIYGLFFPLPAQRRGSNVGLLSALYIFSILAIWGLLFTLARISGSGTLTPEVGIILPIILLSFGSLFLARRYQNS